MSSPLPENPPETGSDVGPGKPPKEHQFKPGESGNRGGRPKGIAKRVREKLGADGDVLVSLWEGMISGYLVSVNPETQEREYEKVTVSDRIAASKLLAERGWGKPPQFAPVEDDDPLDMAAEAATQAAISLDAHIDEVAAQRLKREGVVDAASAQEEGG